MSKRILVVDDSMTVRQVLKMTLEGAGYEVVEAEDGFDALGRLETNLFEMVVTDLNMPNLDGIGLIRRIRENLECRFMPIIMLTTESAEGKKRAGKEAGASGWIVKPFKPEQLLKVVSMVLG